MESKDKKRGSFWPIGLLVCQLCACSVPGGDGIVGTGVTVQKTSTQGPYIKSSELVSHALNADGSRLGDTRVGHVDMQTATVQLQTDRVGPVLLVINGSHLNEITGQWSEQWLSLRAVSMIKENESPRATIDTLTHIAHKRVMRLMASGLSVEAASIAAERETLVALQAVLRPIDDDFTRTSGKVTATGLGNSEIYVAALSAVTQAYAMERYARRPASSPDAEYAYLLNRLVVWVRDAKPLADDIVQGLRDAARRIRPDIVRDMLVGRGVWPKNLAAPNPNPLDFILDTDGDGSINKEDDDIDGDGVPNAQDSSPYSAANS